MDEFLKAKFDRIDQFAQLPDPVRASLLSHFSPGEEEFRSHIANPGERFNATDVVDPSFPMRRLRFAGVGPALSFVYYEHGGIGFHYHLTIYRRGASAPVFAGRFTRGFSGGKLREPPKTILELKEWLSSGEIEDDAIQNDDW